MAKLSETDAPSVSPDARYVAYCVQLPAWKLSSIPAGAAPAKYQRHRLFIAETATGRITPIGSQAVNSWGAAWAPNGRSIAFYSDEGGEVGLWKFQLGEKSATRLGKDTVFASYQMQPQFSPDGQRIFIPTTVPMKQEATNPAPSAEVPADNAGHPTVVVRTTERVDPDKSGESVAQPNFPETQSLVEGQPASLTAVSIADGHSEKVLPAGSTPSFMGAKLSPTGKYLACESGLRAVRGNELKVVIDLTVVRSSDGKTIHRTEGVELDVNMNPNAPTFVTMAWNPKADRLAFVHNGKLMLAEFSNGNSHLSEVPLNLQKGQPIQQVLFSSNGRDLFIASAAADSQVENPRLGTLSVVSLQDGRARDLALPAGVQLQRLLSATWSTALQPRLDCLNCVGLDKSSGDQVFVQMPVDGSPGSTIRPEGRVRVVASAADHSQSIGVVENASTAPDYFTLNREFKPGVRLSRAEPELEGISIGPVDIFDTKIRAWDGQEREVQSAIALPPGGKKGGKYPTIVVLYPGMNLSTQKRSFGGGDAATIPTAIFTTRGYAVILVDVALAPLGSPSNLLSDIQASVLPQIERSIQLGYTDPDRIGVLGHSFGAYGTACLLCNTSVFRGAVAISGMYDFAGSYAASRPDEMPLSDKLVMNMFYMEQHQGRMGKPLWSDPKRYIDNSPYFQADKIQAPLLLLHGDQDSNCPVGESDKLFNALRRLERQATIAVYRGEGHSPEDWSNANRLDLVERILRFFDARLKASAAR